jgi:hypothetical protein
MLTKADRQQQYKALERIREIRIENIRKLRDRYGSWAALSRALGLHLAYLTHIAGPNPRKAIGEEFARNVEVTLKLPTHWLDNVHK